MSKFNGVINVDVRDSVPDWAPYTQPAAPDGAPNVVYIVLDDAGFASLGCFGGLIDTPNIDALAERGLKYTNFHTTALCSPTRSCLLTGRNHTTNGMACVADATTGFPGSNGHIPFECGTIAEVLGERGWNTYAVGKWHLAPDYEMNIASTKRNWPLGRGFERFYGFLGGETNQWYPDLYYDNHPVEPPASPEEGYHLTPDLVDKAISFVADSKSIAPEKPFFLYFCPGAVHAPHHAPHEWIDRFRGRFDMGYEVYRELVFARQKELGILPEHADLTAVDPYREETGADGTPWPAGDTVRPWESLSDDERALFSRMAEVFAGFLAHTDHEIGRLLGYLDSIGEADNTIVVLLSDNGASGEGGPNGSVNENLFFNGLPDSIEGNLEKIDELGSPSTFNHYPTGWAWAFNTPFKLWKRYTFEGGIADSMIVSFPRGIAAPGGVRRQYCHASDIVPTLYEALGIELPEVVRGYPQIPLEGTSFKNTWDDPDAATAKQTQYYVMLGSRAIWHEGWKATAVHASAPSQWSHFDQDRWELYDTVADPTESHDLADEHPDKVAELVRLWFHEAGKYHGLPLEDRGVELLTLERPTISKPRTRYVYFPNTSAVGEGAAVNIRNRSYTIAAEVEITSDQPAGVIFAQGSRFGGHALYLRDGVLKYVYNFCGLHEQLITATRPVAGGRAILSAVFEKSGDALPTTGTLTLYVNDLAVGSGQIRTQPGKFSLAGEGLCVGRDSGQAVTDDYAGTSPYPATGCVIDRVMVDVSGEPYVNLEHEARAAFMRD